jgi:D-alanine-D-alanine ligase
MAKKKLRVGILFGGKSGEHEVSLRSGRSILAAIDRTKYDVVELGITPQGRWLQGGAAQKLIGEPITASRETTLSLVQAAAEPGATTGLDVVFPVLHGTFGEDGTIQGLFELADIAYVGSGVLGSAAGMDKDAMKRMFAAAGLPMTPHVTLLRSEWRADAKKCVKAIEKALKYPVFVKPANLGSSVGISKVKRRAELAAAIELAAKLDRKIVVEQGVGGAGVKPRELVPAKEFYDYEAKYELSGPDESVCIIPAKLSKADAAKIPKMAVEAFRACDCAGLARVDFLMAPAAKGKPAKIVLNEVNTMPGFTSISMYPKLWAASGLPYAKLIDRLIELALERHREKQQTSFTR